MNVLDLFSGIGGFSLGLERAGMRTIAFCEIDPYCRAVLRKHWPDVPIYGDIRELTGAQVMADAARCRWGRVEPGRRPLRGNTDPSGNGEGGIIDLICGGWPCQDISVAGKGAGLDGERSGLWSEFARIIGEVRPRYVILENVSALLGRGVDRVCGDLAAFFYDCEGHVISASAFGACHRRDRIWIIAYANGGRRESLGLAQHDEQQSASGHVTDGLYPPGWWNGAPAANTGLQRLSQWPRLLTRRQVADAAATSCLGWPTEPPICRADDGIPHRVDRLKALGNSLVPQVVEVIGRAIMNAQPKLTK